MDRLALFEDVRENVEAYKEFLQEHGAFKPAEWEEIPIITKDNYLLKYPAEKTIRRDRLDKWSLIGASSGFSKTGSVYWLKGGEDEESYFEAVERLLEEYYGIHKKRTLIVVALAFGMWIGGMQLACAMRSLASRVKYPLTTALPGLDLKEVANIVKRFRHMFDQVIIITNASNVSIVYALLKDDPRMLDGTVFFPVVGEYFSEHFRRDIAVKFGHGDDYEFVLWTGYGSADTGDVAIETRDTIALRKHLAFEDQEFARDLFGVDDVPMIMEINPQSYVEIVDGDIVVTKDQLIPLIRYNTRDKGGLLDKEKLRGRIDDELYRRLPDTILYVLGRAENSVIFYGTNLMITEIGRFFYSLGEECSYSGLFEVEKKVKNGIDTFHFTVYTYRDVTDKTDFCRDKLIDFLKSYSREFAVKYDRLSEAAGMELITLRLERLTEDKASKKHRFIKE